MKNFFVEMKEACQYVGIILLACGAAVWLMVKRAGYQGIGFTCGGFIHQTSKNEMDCYPAWVDKANLRFVYRIWKEPHTRKRYLMAGLLFPARFIAERIFG